MEKIRSPIVTTMGHIDHGKTSILDRIRNTNVTRTEAGEITQHISSSFVPLETIKKIAGSLMKKFNFDPKFPGLLFIDTPGHAAFVNLRKRGGSVADIALLVIDINEGIKEQTEESIKVLKMYKTPFVVALNKIDKIQGWKPTGSLSFLEAISKQKGDTKMILEQKLYEIVGQLAEYGFESERFDRVYDFTKQVALIPTSAKTGEGIAEILLLLAGLSQKFLGERLKLSDIGRGVVLEIKEMRGLGLVMDSILFDGVIKRNDRIVIGGVEPVVTKIKALLVPRPLQDIRIEKKFKQMNEVIAAAGVRIVANGLENVIPGAPFRVVRESDDLNSVIKEVQAEIGEVQFKRESEGVVIKADTLGSLEALIKMLENENIPIKKAEVGKLTKEDFVFADLNDKEEYRAILMFNVVPTDENKKMANDYKIRIFSSNVIYRIIEEYKEWLIEIRERRIQEALEKVNRPVVVKVLPDYIFRRSDPAIFGAEVVKGYLKRGTELKREDGKVVGKVKDIQKENRPIDSALSGDRVAISMESVMVGRTFRDNATLTSNITNRDLVILRKYADRLTEDERELLKEWGLL